MTGPVRTAAAIVAFILAAALCSASQAQQRVQGQRLAVGHGGQMLVIADSGNTAISASLYTAGQAAHQDLPPPVTAPPGELLADPAAAWDPIAKRYLLAWVRLDAEKKVLAIAFTWLDDAGSVTAPAQDLAALSTDADGHRPFFGTDESEPLEVSCASSADTCIVTWYDHAKGVTQARIVHQQSGPEAATVAAGDYAATSVACADDGSSCVAIGSSAARGPYTTFATGRDLTAFVLAAGGNSARTLQLSARGDSPAVSSVPGGYAAAWAEESHPNARDVWAATFSADADPVLPAHAISRRDPSDIAVVAAPGSAPLALFTDRGRTPIIGADITRTAASARGQAVIDGEGVQPLTAGGPGSLTAYTALITDPAARYRPAVPERLRHLNELPDRLAPHVDVSTRSVGRSPAHPTAAVVTVACDEPCAFRGDLQISPPDPSRPFVGARFRARITDPTKRVVLRVKLPRRALRHIQQVEYAGHDAAQTAVVHVRDSAGNHDRAFSKSAQLVYPSAVSRPGAPTCEHSPGTTVLRHRPLRIYRSGAESQGGGETHQWWACRVGRRDRIRLTVPDQIYDRALFTGDLMLVTTAEDTADEGILATIGVYDIKRQRRLYKVDAASDLTDVVLAPNGASAALVDDAGPNRMVVGVSSSGDLRVLNHVNQGGPYPRIRDLAIDGTTVHWTEDGVARAAPLPRRS